MIKACVIDHSFHQRTKSLDFIKDFLSKKYDLDHYWDHSWDKGKSVPAEVINKYPIVFFLQNIPSVKQLKRIKAKIVWVPMYDSISRSEYYWYRLSFLPLKIISFSRTLYEYIRTWGMDCLHVQYFRNPTDYSEINDFSKNRVFFWYRGDIKFNVLGQVIDGQAVASMDILSSPDPGFDGIDREISSKPNISIHRDFLDKKEYLSLIARNNIFFASRSQEGIGMSFLEAMAMGACVIAHNAPTMNEYIRDGENGLLVDMRKPCRLNLDHMERLGRQARKDCFEGWQTWNEDIHKIFKFVEGDFGAPRMDGMNTFIFSGGLYVRSKIKGLMARLTGGNV